MASAGIILLPLGYVTAQALSADPVVWSRLWATRIPELLFNTVSLAASVAVITLVLGVSTAWLGHTRGISRSPAVGRSPWSFHWRCRPTCWPTSTPTYWDSAALSSISGNSVAGPQARIFSPHSYWGATLVMALDTFPFVYLLSRSALLSMNVSFEEVARASGVSRLSTLWRVTLPLMRPSIAAGVALVILYVVSDFGAVSLLRYQTLTYAVFQQMTGRSDNTAASILSLLLVGLALIFLITERWFRQRSRFYQTTGRYRVPQRHRYGWLGTIAVTGYLGLIVGAAFALPASLLIQWSLSPEAQATLDNRFFGFVWNSGILAASAATGRRIDRLAAGLPRQPETRLWLNIELSASRLCRLCASRTGGGTGRPGPLYQTVLPFFYGSVLDPDRGLRDPLSPSRAPVAGAGAAARSRRIWKRSRAHWALAFGTPGDE